MAIQKEENRIVVIDTKLGRLIYVGIHAKTECDIVKVTKGADRCQATIIIAFHVRLFGK